MHFTVDMQIVELDSFETAFPVEPGSEDETKRRFMTLFVEQSRFVHVGGTSYVCRAQSVMGETYALKRLLPGTGMPTDIALSNEDRARITQGHIAAFYEEYTNQVLVSRLRGFPRVFGYGMIAGDPVIVMEWIEGVSLDGLVQHLAERDERPSASLIAEIGVGVLEVLDTLSRIDGTLVHRDISPSNIMIRTSAASLDEQIEAGAFDICLIDFGSAVSNVEREASFTMTSQVWRHGTPEYAPPEMLTQDIPYIDELRRSQSIDVFALCSVLYKLYAGHTPWRVGGHPEISPFRLKTESPPEPLVARTSEDMPLTGAIMAGLAVEQPNRPCVQALLRTMRDALLAQGGTIDAEESVFGSSALDRGRQDLYTPDSTHLTVATAEEGGRRASEAISQFEQRRRALVTRRSFIIGGVAIAAAAVAGGAITARSCGEGGVTSHLIDESLLAEEIYSGEPMYPARADDTNEWFLIGGSGASMIALDTNGREPGSYVDGLIKAYDTATGGYGFKTPTTVNGLTTASVARWAIDRTFANAGDFSPASESTERLAPVEDPESLLWGYIDVNGDYAIQPSYRQANSFRNGFASVQANDADRLWGTIDQSGTQVIKPVFHELGLCSEEGLMAARDDNGLWGFIDLDGNWTTPASYLHIRRFGSRLAGVYDSEKELWGFIDANGTQAIDASFLDVRVFFDGLAPAQDAKTHLWGLIDTSGTWYVEPCWLSLGDKTGDLFPAHGSPDNPHGIEADSAESEMQRATGRVGYGYVDANGNWIHLPQYGDTLIRPTPQ